MKALGIEGDTPRDTVATLRGAGQAVAQQYRPRSPTTRTRRPRTSACVPAGAIDQRIQTALDGERSRLQQDHEQVTNDRQQTQGLLQDLQRRLDSLSGKGGQADLPVGPGPGGRRRQEHRRQSEQRRPPQQ